MKTTVAEQSSVTERGLAALVKSGRTGLLRCFILVIAGFAAHLPALQGIPFWDDDYLVQENPFARSPLLIAESFGHYLFPDSLSSHYRPVQNISLCFDYLVWNSTWYGYHLTNLLLHIGCSILLYFLLSTRLAPLLKIDSGRKLPTASLTAFVLAAIWVVHPVHSAAVDYISGRADSLAFFFAATSWLLYLHGQTKGSSRARFAYYGFAILSGMLALCSREIACIWVIIFLAYNCFFIRHVKRSTKLRLVVIAVAMLVVYAGLRSLPERRSGAPKTEGWSAPTRAVLMLRALGDYGRLMVWPSTLRMERNVMDPQNYLGNTNWRTSADAEYLSLVGLGVAAVLVFGSFKGGIAQRTRVFGAIWFIAGYLPISNLIELNATVAEHWLYLPSVGLLIFVGGCVLELQTRGRRIACVVATIAIGGFATRAYMRSSDWVDPRTFYERTIAAGKSSNRVAVNLGIVYANSGELQRAETVFRRVLQLTPDYPIARTNLADVLYREGKRDEGEALFAQTRAAAPEARKEYPRTWTAALNLAHIRHNQEDDTGALEILSQAGAEYPDVWEIARSESELLREHGRSDAALGVVATFAESHWWHYGATLALGQLLAERGDVERAAEQLRFASWLDVHDARALSLLASIRLRQNRLTDALAAQQSATSRQPDEPSHYTALSQILSAMGRNSEAQLAMAKLAKLRSIAAQQ